MYWLYAPSDVPPWTPVSVIDKELLMAGHGDVLKVQNPSDVNPNYTRLGSREAAQQLTSMFDSEMGVDVNPVTLRLFVLAYPAKLRRLIDAIVQPTEATTARASSAKEIAEAIIRGDPENLQVRGGFLNGTGRVTSTPNLSEAEPETREATVRRRPYEGREF